MTPGHIFFSMIIGPTDERAARTAIAELLAVAYGLLLERDDATLNPAIDAVFGALESVDMLAGGIHSPRVRETLDAP